MKSEGPRSDSAEEDLALRHVDPANRVELSRFVREDEAELACGMLRANGIACQLSSEVIPGLPAEVILWVNNRDAKSAWALLADAESPSSSEDNHAA